MSRLIVWRHGNTEWNADERVQGQTDTALNDLGRSQAAAAAQLLAAFKPDAIVASDLQRALDTALALAALTGLPVSTDVRLRERHYGQWQGLTMSEVAARFPAENARWRAGEAEIGCGVESQEDVAKRAGEALQAAADANPDGTVVVATHGGAARQGCGYLLGLPTPVMSVIRPLQNCHWTELVHDVVRGWQLRSHNVGPWLDRPIPAAV